MIDDDLNDLIFDDVADFFSDYFDRLNDAFLFNPQKFSDDDSAIGKLTNEIFRELIFLKKYKLKEKKLFLNSFLTNLALSYRRCLPIAFPKGSNHYSIDNIYGLNHYSYSIAEQILKAAESYYIIKNGFYDNTKGKGKFTRIQPSDKLKKIFSLISNEFEAVCLDENTILLKDPLKAGKKELARPIILKAEKLFKGKKKLTKKRKEYPTYYSPNTKISQKIKFLNRYNKFIEGVEIFFPIDESFVSRLKDEDTAKKTLDFIKRLKFYLSEISPYNPDITELKQIYSLINIIQQTSHTHITTPLLVKIEDKYLLFSKLNGKIHSIYHRGSFKKGGRFYGGGYQSLNEKQRSRILINNEKVIELDYGGFHLRMLYHLEGLEYLIDPYDVFNGNTELRDLMKVVSLICINARTEGKAINGINNLFFEEPELKSIASKNGMTAKELIKSFKSFHNQIKKYFFLDMGVDLMYYDSQIAEEVLKYFLKRKIPCLPIHDSFLVPEKYKDELYLVMKETYFNKFHFDAVIK